MEYSLSMDILLGSLTLSIVGLLTLVAGGEALVAGAGRLAQHLRIPPAIVGLTIVAFATSVPELCVSMIAVSKGSPDIAVGNVFGSNVFNTLMVIGVAAWLMGNKNAKTGGGSLTVERTVFRRELLECCILTAVITAIVFASQDASGGYQIPVWLGGFLLVGLVVMLFRLIRDAKNSTAEVESENEELPLLALLLAATMAGFTVVTLYIHPEIFAIKNSNEKQLLLFSVISVAFLLFAARLDRHQLRKEPGTVGSILMLCLGLGALVGGSNLLVVGAQGTAEAIGISEAVVALIGIAIGTSAPELATTVAAVRRNDVDMAVGNAIGSNLFNLLAVLGAATVYHGTLHNGEPLAPLNARLPWDALAATLAVLIILVAARKQPHSVSRRAGVFMVFGWFAYVGTMAWDPASPTESTPPTEQAEETVQNQ